MTPAPPSPGGVGGPTTRQRVLEIAEQLYVLRGHDGFSFADIATAVGTTRANIHHHFGNKRRLMAELIDGFTRNALDRITQHWTAGEGSFSSRLARQVGDLRDYYDRFNPEPGDRNVWSPLSRLRLDLPVLGDLALTALERVNHAYGACLAHAVTAAVQSGELAPETPVGDLVQMLRTSLLSCGPATQDRGSFDDVDGLFAAMERLILAAWGSNDPR